VKAVDAYGQLFPNREPAAVHWVTFQRAVLRERMPRITEDESRKVEEFIETRFKEDNDLRDQPWQVMKVDESQTDVDLEKQYNAR
jgi:hypothetical protein